MEVIIAFDPGVSTGVCVWQNRKLIYYTTIKYDDINGFLELPIKFVPLDAKLVVVMESFVIRSDTATINIGNDPTNRTIEVMGRIMLIFYLYWGMTFNDFILQPAWVQSKPKTYSYRLKSKLKDDDNDSLTYATNIIPIPSELKKGVNKHAQSAFRHGVSAIRKLEGEKIIPLPRRKSKTRNGLLQQYISATLG